MHWFQLCTLRMTISLANTAYHRRCSGTQDLNSSPYCPLLLYAIKPDEASSTTRGNQCRVWTLHLRFAAPKCATKLDTLENSLRHSGHAVRNRSSVPIGILPHHRTCTRLRVSNIWACERYWSRWALEVLVRSSENLTFDIDPWGSSGGMAERLCPCDSAAGGAVCIPAVLGKTEWKPPKLLSILASR